MAIQPQIQRMPSEAQIQQPLVADEHLDPAADNQLQINLALQTPPDTIANNQNFQKLKVISEQIQQIVEKQE